MSFLGGPDSSQKVRNELGCQSSRCHLHWYRRTLSSKGFGGIVWPHWLWDIYSDRMPAFPFFPSPFWPVVHTRCFFQVQCTLSSRNRGEVRRLLQSFGILLRIRFRTQTNCRSWVLVDEGKMSLRESMLNGSKCQPSGSIRCPPHVSGVARRRHMPGWTRRLRRMLCFRSFWIAPNISVTLWKWNSTSPGAGKEIGWQCF